MRTSVLVAATALAMADHRLLVPADPKLIVPPDIERRRQLELMRGEGTKQTPQPATELSAADVAALTAAHQKRMRKAGIDIAKQVVIAVSDLGGDNPARFETEVGTVYLISRASWDDLLAKIEGDKPAPTEEGSAETAGVLGTLNGVPVIDMDEASERALAVSIAISKAMQALMAKARS